MQSPLLPFADELTRLTDRQLCDLVNQPLDDTVSDLPTIVLDCDDNSNETTTMTTTQLTSYQKWRSVGYPALIAYRMAKGDINARLCGMSYSGKRDCHAYTNDSNWSGWIFFIIV